MLETGKLVPCFLAVAVLCLSATSAWAQEEPEALIRQGVELRREGKDALAQGYFKRAYSIAHTSRSAAQLGLVEQALGFFVDAEEHLSEALENADAWVDENRGLLEQSRAFVRGKLVRVQTRGLRSGATVELAGRRPSPVPADGVVWVQPGPSTLKFAAPDHASVVREVAGAAGETVALDVESPTGVPAPRVAPATGGGAIATPATTVSSTAEQRTERSNNHGLRAAGIVVASSGVALAAAGVVAYLVGSSKLNAINHDAAAGAPYNTANGNYQTFADVGIGLGIAGALGLATGAALYYFGSAPRAERGASVSVGYLPGVGGQLRFGGHF